MRVKNLEISGAMDLLAQMATFVRVVETGSLSAAARAQKLSLPAVSRQLRTLEEDLGAALITRLTRRLAVTEAGQRWYEHCLRILNELENARGAVGGSVRGTLVVSAAVTLGMYLLVPRLATLIQRHPGLAIDLCLEDRVIDLVGEAVERCCPRRRSSTRYGSRYCASNSELSARRCRVGRLSTQARNAQGT